MKKKCLVLILSLALLVGCSGKSVEPQMVTDNAGENVNIYISANGDLLYGSGILSDDNFALLGDVRSLGIREKKDVISEIVVDKNDKIYCSITTSNGTGFGETVYVVKENNIEKVVYIEEEYGASLMAITDDRVYVQGAIVPAELNPEGVPYVGIDINTHELNDRFAVKGIVAASATYCNDIYKVYTLKKGKLIELNVNNPDMVNGVVKVTR